MDPLIAGYARFRADHWPERRRLFEHLADGQRPRTMVVACADSRVDPAMIFDASPGELFIARNVANLVPPFGPDSHHHGTSAALEFAVRVLEVEEIVVLGHALCGGVSALMSGMPPAAPDYLGPWMALAARARTRALACEAISDKQLACEFETVKLSLDNLRTFPWVAERVDAGRLRLRGAHFDIRSGVLILADAHGAFAPAPEHDADGPHASPK
jgi:carbonic anhydrase